MPSRTIVASITSGSNADKAGGSYITFGSIYSDTGAVANATPTSATLFLSSYKSYSSTFYLNVIFGGNAGTIVGRTYAMASNSSTHSSTETLIDLSGMLTSSAVNMITLGVVSTSGSGNKINIRGECSITLTINYNLNITDCTAPTSVTVSPTVVDAGTDATLSWSGAGAGIGNPIGGYAIYRNAGSGYSYLSAVAANISSTTVTAPSSMGSSYDFKVAVIASYNNLHTLSGATATLTAKTYGVCSPPTSVSVSKTNVAPGAGVTLSWSGGSAGINNGITGFTVYRATSATGVYSQLTTVSVMATSGSTTVYAPTTSSSSYYYKVSTTGTKSGFNSAMSTIYATLTCRFTAPSAPDTVTIDGGVSAYAASGDTVTLAWSGAKAGTNNPVASYSIYRDGALYASELPASTTSRAVVAQTTAGSSYSYTVVACGKYSNSSASVARVVYTYSAPGAPTTLSVSSDTPDAGEDVTLSWSGASAGSYNGISGYNVYRSTSASGSYAYLNFTTSTSCTVTAPSEMGASYFYKVQTAGVRSNSALSSLYAAVTAKTYTACSPSATVSLSSAYVAPGTAVTLSWTAGTAGTNNAITGYRVDRRLNSGSFSLLKTTDVNTRSIPVTAPDAPGSSYGFYVVTLGTKSGYDSAASTTVTLSSYTYTNCSPPTTVTLSASIAEGDLKLSWSGASAGTHNGIKGFEIQYQDSDDNSAWGAWTLLTTTSRMTTSDSVTVSPSTTRGAYRRFSVRTVGQISGYDSTAVISDSVRKNRLPAAPSFLTGTATYETSPMLRLALGTEPDGQAQTLYVAVDSEPAAASNPTSRLKDLTVGLHNVKAYAVDSLGAASPAIQQTVEVLASHDTDPVLTARQTTIKAAHINDLRKHIDTEYAYHGVAAYPWSAGPTAGQASLALWLQHVLELRTAIDKLCTVIGTEKPVWTALSVNCPQAAVMNELRQAAVHF